MLTYIAHTVVAYKKNVEHKSLPNKGVSGQELYSFAAKDTATPPWLPVQGLNGV